MKIEKDRRCALTGLLFTYATPYPSSLVWPFQIQQPPGASNRTLLKNLRFASSPGDGRVVIG